MLQINSFFLTYNTDVKTIEYTFLKELNHLILRDFPDYGKVYNNTGGEHKVIKRTAKKVI